MVSVSEVVDVSIRVQSSSVAATSFDSILLAGNGGTGTNDGNFNAGFLEHEVRSYSSYDALAADVDIKPSSNILGMAQSAFSQVPAVPTVYVSRIDEGTPAVQVSTLTVQTGPVITGQSFEVKIDGVEIAGSPVAFSTDNDTTMAAVASAIAAESEVDTAVASGDVGSEDLITVTGAIAGESFLVTMDLKTGTTVDESVSQVITTAAVDKITAADINAIFANDGRWFGYAHDFTSNSDAETAAGALAALKKYGAFRFESVASSPNLGTNFSFKIYNSSADSVKKWAQVAWLSTMLGRPIGSYNPAYLTLQLTDASSLTGSEESTLRDADANQYSEIGGTDLTYDGKAGDGGWIDTYINVLWLEARTEERVFATMTSADKIPYNDDGIAIIVNSVAAQLQAAEDAGVINASPKYVITYPLASEISASDKTARLLNDISFTAYSGSGINTVKIAGTLVD